MKPPHLPGDPDAPDIYAAEMDIFSFLDEIEDESIDGVLSDWPYPSTERYRAIGTTTRTKESKKSSNPWYGVMSIAELSRVLDVLYTKLKKDSYLFAYVDDDSLMLLMHARGVLDDLAKLNDLDKLKSGEVKPSSRGPRDHAGFMWRNPFTWVKVARESDGEEPAEDIRLASGTGYHGRRCTERIMVLAKGEPKMRVSLNNAQLAARPKPPAGATIKRASAKPIIIAERIARAIADPGGTILDPFIGAGTHAIGIQRAGCDVIANDINLATFKDWLGAEGRPWTPW